MKKLLLAAALMLLTGGAAFGQTQSITLTNTTGGGTSGTFARTATFSLTTTATYSGYSAIGLSYWLQVPTALAPYLTITGATYSTFTTAQQADYPKTFTDSAGASTGFLSDKGSGSLSGDLGAATPGGTGVAAGTYQVTTLSFALNNAPTGTYSLQSTTVGTKISVVSDSNFVTHNLGTATYALSVVPEPSSWALLAGGGILLVATVRLRRPAV